VTPVLTPVLTPVFTTEGAFWIFAYGSLMWDPGFPVAGQSTARLRGYHRALCILSIRNRGTEARPGLVVGLNRGGSCVGRALKVPAETATETLAYLQDRELSTNAYLARWVPVTLENGTRFPALAFVARPGHPQHVQGLTDRQQAALVVQGTGPYGTSLDYLREVCRRLDASGIPDGPLHRVLTIAESLAAAGASGDQDPPPAFA
jgi:cation transport protein ChaC